MERLRHRVDRILETAVALIMAMLVVDVLWQVFTRFILRDPSSWTEEVARYLLIWVGLLGAAYAAGRGMHLALDLLPGRLSGSRQRRLTVLIESCAFLFALGALVVGGTRLVYVTLRLGQTSAALEMPIGLVYLVVPLSGLLIMYYSIDHVRRLGSNTSEEARDGVA